MKQPQQICNELRGLEGTIGAVVLRNARCIASSLPPLYSGERVDAVAQCLLRLQRLAHRSGYREPNLVLHFERTVIRSWYADSNTALAVFCLPDAASPLIELSGGMAVDDLKDTAARWSSGAPDS